MVVLALWSTKGGAGCTVLAAGAVRAAAVRDPQGALAVDVGGDLALLLQGAAPEGPGVAEWLRAGGSVPADALARIEQPLPTGGAILPRGRGALEEARVASLAEVLGRERRQVVVDLGQLDGAPELVALADAADRSVLVVRACPLSLARLRATMPTAPTAVAVVRDRHRRVDRAEIEAAAGAPVVVEVEVDPAIGAAIDAGLVDRRLPRSFLRAVGALG